eukprot:TRINITY_DN1943_c0_g1_i3.p2 TRINITY_DN1943_c0_g1~~TRINITY_DN1943_c0_g1_i3.p2  ORF type:complete len:326 (+),score=63.90 TRINITY_DN1943_c0_g1_i3:1513-2490(+)
MMVLKRNADYDMWTAPRELRTRNPSFLDEWIAGEESTWWDKFAYTCFNHADRALPPSKHHQFVKFCKEHIFLLKSGKLAHNDVLDRVHMAQTCRAFLTPVPGRAQSLSLTLAFAPGVYAHSSSSATEATVQLGPWAHPFVLPRLTCTRVAPPPQPPAAAEPTTPEQYLYFLQHTTGTVGIMEHFAQSTCAVYRSALYLLVSPCLAPTLGGLIPNRAVFSLHSAVTHLETDIRNSAIAGIAAAGSMLTRLRALHARRDEIHRQCCGGLAQTQPKEARLRLHYAHEQVMKLLGCPAKKGNQKKVARKRVTAPKDDTPHNKRQKRAPQ